MSNGRRVKLIPYWKWHYGQFYVGNTRFRGAHAIYVLRKAEILHRIGKPDAARELATEFIERHGFDERVHLVPRPLRNLSPQMRVAWLAQAAKQMRGETCGERHVI